MSQNEEISLYYKDGKSNKEYHAQLLSQDSEFIVNFQYGRVGSTLKTGSKTAKPLPYDKAKSIYDKLVKSKVKKGYSEGEAGVTYQHSDLESRKTGILPQLLNPISDQDVEKVMQDDQYCLQEKHDGVRMMVKKTQQEILGINRRGLSVNLPTPIADALQAMSSIDNCLVDGECMGDQIVLFDLLEVDGEDLRNTSYQLRLERLTDCFSDLGGTAILTVKTAYNHKEKRSLHAVIESQQGEGVVLKDLSAHYTPDRPASKGPQLKFKFYATASVIVTGISDSKRSVSMSVFKDQELVSIGNVTVPVNQEIPPVDAILEVRYLYAYPNGGSLYQPIFLNTRSDIDKNDCHINQLKYKVG